MNAHDLAYAKQENRIAELERRTKRLSENEITNLWLFLEGKSEGVLQSGGTFNFPVEFARAIEERHGIK